MSNGQVIVSKTYSNATHPNQVVRRIVNDLSSEQAVIVYVMNERGERWAFSVKKMNGKYAARLMTKTSIILSKDSIDTVFSGNTSIKEAGKYE